MTQEKISVMELTQEIVTSQEKIDAICRICKEKETEEYHLCIPCYCTGNMRYVHERCILEWIKKKGNQKCEFCRYEITLRLKYTQRKRKDKYSQKIELAKCIILYLIQKVVLYGKSVFSAVSVCMVYLLTMLYCTIITTSVLEGGQYLFSYPIITLHKIYLFSAGWIASKASSALADEIIALVYLMTYSISKKIPVDCKYEDVEFYNTWQRQEKESIADKVETIEKIGLFDIENTASHKTFRTKSLTSEEICNIFTIVLFEEENPLEKRSVLVKKVKDEARAKWKWLNNLLCWRETSNTIRSFIYLLTTAGTFSMIMYLFLFLPMLAGKILMRLSIKIWSSIVLRGMKYVLNLFVRAWVMYSPKNVTREIHICMLYAKKVISIVGNKIWKKEKWLPKSNSMEEMIFMESIIQCTVYFLYGLVNLLYIFWCLKDPWFVRKREFPRTKRALYSIYLSTKIWAFFLVEYIIMPFIAGYFLSICIKYILQKEIEFIGSILHGKVRIILILIAYLGVGCLVVEIADIFIERVLAEMYRPGIFYWICLRKRNVLDTLLREKLLFLLHRSVIHALQVFIFSLCICIPVLVHKAVAERYLFLSTTEIISTRFSLERICGILYLLIFSWRYFSRYIYDMVKYILFRGTEEISKKVAVFLHLNSLLHDGPLPCSAKELQPMLRYLPSKKEIAYRTEEVEKRMSLNISMCERILYFDDTKRKRKMHYRERYLDKEENDRIWPESLIYSTRDQLLLNPSFSVYYIPNRVRTKIFFYISICSMYNIFCISVLLILASFLWKIIELLNRSTYMIDTLEIIPGPIQVFISLAIISIIFHLAQRKIASKKKIAEKTHIADTDDVLDIEITENTVSKVNITDIIIQGIILPCIGKKVTDTKEIIFTLFSASIIMFSFHTAFPILFADALDSLPGIVFIDTIFPVHYIVCVIMYAAVMGRVLTADRRVDQLIYVHFSISLFIYIIVDELLFKNIVGDIRIVLRVLLVCFPGILLYGFVLGKMVLRVIKRLPEVAFREMHWEQIGIFPICKCEISETSEAVESTK